MARNPLYSLAVVVASAILLLATSATAAPAPAGALFHSDFADFGADWHSLPHVSATSVTQLDDRVSATAPQPQNSGRFSSQRSIETGPFALEDLEIVLDLDRVDATRVDLLLAWFGSDGRWIDSTQVLRVLETPTDSLVTPLEGVAAPEGWSDFVLLFFVRGGEAIFDEVALVPAAVPTGGTVVPEPSTSLLFALGLGGLTLVPSRRGV